MSYFILTVIVLLNGSPDVHVMGSLFKDQASCEAAKAEIVQAIGTNPKIDNYGVAGCTQVDLLVHNIK